MHIALMAVSAASTPAGVCRHAANLARNLQPLIGVNRITLLTGAWQAKYFERAFGLSGRRLGVIPIDIPYYSLGLVENVLLLHGLPDATLASLYRRCELFVSTSVVEGDGLPLAEAIAHGCRVLCTDSPTHREICAGDGTLLPVDSEATELAAAIATALRAPRPTHNHHFLTPSQAASQYLAIYQGLLQSKDIHPTSTTTFEPFSTGDA